MTSTLAIKKIIFTAIAILSCCAVSMFCQAKQMRFEQIPVELGYQRLGPIVDIVQDNYGFLWFAGQSGIARYDGTRFKFYFHQSSNPHSLANDYAHDLHIDKDGNLWIGTDNGLSRYNFEQDNFINYFAQTNSQNANSNALKSKNLSNSIIYAIAHDARNNLYLATHDGVNIFDQTQETFTLYQPNNDQKPDTPPKSKDHNTIHAIMVDSEQNVWIGTQNLGLAKLDVTTGKFQFYRHEDDNHSSLVHDGVKHLLEDSRKRIWVATYGGGISRLDPNTGAFKNYQHDAKNKNSIGSNTIWKVFEDSKQNIWFATDQGGLAKYRENSQDFEHLTHSPSDSTSISSNVVRAIFEDRHGGFWFGFFPSGISYHHRSASVFENHRHSPDDPNSISSSAILSFLEDNDGTLWIGTEGGLNAMDSNSGTFKRFTAESEAYPSLKSNAILALGLDSKDQVWVGTWSGGLHIYNKASDSFRNFLPSNTEQSPNSLFIWNIFNESNNMWLGTETGGLNLFKGDSQTFEYFRHDEENPNSLNNDFVYGIVKDQNGVLWVGTLSGLNSFNPNTKQFSKHPVKQILKRNGDAPTHPDSPLRTRALMLDHNGKLWIGTSDDGVYIYDANIGKVKHLSTDDGLPAKHVATIIQDKQHNVWLGTIDGLVRVKPENWEIRVFRQSDGLAGNTINRNASYMDKRGNIYIGTTNGFSIFDPKKLLIKPIDFPVSLVDFKLFNESVLPNQEQQTLTKNIIAAPTITLQHRDNMFTFEFAALSFKSSHKNIYRYKLDGFDKKWHDVGTQNSATYTNINPGTYTFKMTAANSDGLWSSQTAEQRIVILPPPWKTPWAYTLYTMLFLAAIFIFLQIKTKRLALENARALNTELIRINKIKDNFLTNTSHELRTPLSGMIGIAENLGNDPLIQNSHLKEQTELIKQSGRRLSNLINDILDYAKLTNQELELFREAVDIKAQVDDIINLLTPLASPKGIRILSILQISTPKLFIDSNRTQQILINIIGNAIKYSDSGTITISAKTLEHHLEIQIEDQGIGIPREKLNTIFNAFSQIEQTNMLNPSSTGLGLAVVKKLVELHGGEIFAESTVNQGSKFIFTLPIAQNKEKTDATPKHSETSENAERAFSDLLSPHSSANDLKRLKGKYRTEANRATKKNFDLQKSKPQNAEKFNILIVDDDPVNRIVVKKMLQIHDYNVYEAFDGKAALDLVVPAQKNFEDCIHLIIMDIVMPVMDGLEACEAIRQHYPSVELPIIFLSARHQDHEIAQAFAAGGNEILTKPVSKYELLPRIAEYINILAKNTFKENMH